MKFLPNFLLLFLVCSFCDVGILYEVWHLHASMAMKNVVKKGGELLTTEQIIRSNGAKTLNDVYAKYGLGGDIWNVQPSSGFYCIYRHRTNETHPPSADCDNITETLTTHAKLLTDAGIDYISVDVTNWPKFNQETDITVVRPTEVLFEEWLKLREKGVKTPLISVWPCSPKGGDTWQKLLDIYNNPKYDSLIYKQDGKKVVFIPARPDCQDESVEQEIQSNGGRNDVKTIDMWALFNYKYYSEKQWWGFFSPCMTSSNQYTTSIVGTESCNQPVTEVKKFLKPEVISVSASGSYMLSQTSLPFASPGKLRGLTMQRLFSKILSLKPPHVFLSSFNEHIGGRQKSAFPNTNIGFNMGLPNDPQKDLVWVDTYGSEYSRDVEPTIEGGDTVLKIMKSCIGLYKQGLDCSSSGTHNNLCCMTNNTEIFSNIFSLQAPGGKDYLLTNSAEEKDTLVRRGWKEICNPINGPSVFCVDTKIADGRAGPFMTYNKQISGTVPLYRCFIESSGQHFFSTNKAECELYKLESILGYIASKRGGEMLRGLHRCLGPVSGTHIHALDLTCDKKDAGLLGYVR